VFVYLFEENVRTMIARTESVGMPIRDFIAAGTIVVQQVDPGELTPGQFIHQVQQNVARDEARVVIIDSMNGYLQAMPDAKFLTIQLHELLAYLNHYGVVTLLTVAQHGLLGHMQAPIDLTYLADTVILLRYFEQGGAIRKAVSIVKKRIGSHETTIREFKLTSHGLVVGEALKEFEGVLTGTPSFLGATSQMLATP
jgi:circadian clock protein KaiC